MKIRLSSPFFGNLPYKTLINPENPSVFCLGFDQRIGRESTAQLQNSQNGQKKPKKTIILFLLILSATMSMNMSIYSDYADFRTYTVRYHFYGKNCFSEYPFCNNTVCF